MSIVYFDAYNDGDRLFCKWVSEDAPPGFIVAVARNDVFSDTHRMFVLPAGTSTCALSVGPGAWYVRVGCFVGTANLGRIEWSGIRGPIHLSPSLPVIPLQSRPYELLSHGPHDDGYRVALRDAPAELYYIIRRVHGIAHEWFYNYTPLYKYVDMPAPIQHTKYTFYLWSFPEFPTSSVYMLADGHAFKDVQAEPPATIKSSHDRAAHNAGRVLVNETVTKPAKFASHADYVRYHMALAQMGRK